MRAVLIVLALLCFVSAALQYNDPDPWLWGLFYFAVGLYAVLSSFGWRLRMGLVALVIASIALMVKTWPGVVAYWNNIDGQTLSDAMSRKYPYIEETREFGGSLLAVITTLLAYAGRPRGRDTTANPS